MSIVQLDQLNTLNVWQKLFTKPGKISFEPLVDENGAKVLVPVSIGNSKVKVEKYTWGFDGIWFKLNEVEKSFFVDFYNQIDERSVDGACGAWLERNCAKADVKFKYPKNLNFIQIKMKLETYPIFNETLSIPLEKVSDFIAEGKCSQLLLGVYLWGSAEKSEVGLTMRLEGLLK